MARIISLQSICNHCAVLFVCFSLAFSFRLQILKKDKINFPKSRTKRETSDLQFVKVRVCLVAFDDDNILRLNVVFRKQ